MDLVKTSIEALRNAGLEPQLSRSVDVIVQALNKREQTEADLTSIIAAKDGETVRLRAEISRLRHAFSTSDDLQKGHASEMAALQAQLQQALTMSKAAQREATLSAARPAGGTLQGEVHRLQAELDARAGLVSRLEAEVASQAAAAAARVTELQDSFTAKVADMRRQHQEQLAALSKGQGGGTPTVEVAALKQQLQAQADDVASLQARLGAQQAAVADLSTKLVAAQADKDAEARRAAAAAADVRELTAVNKQLLQQVQELRAQAAQPGAASHQASGGSQAAPPSADMAPMLAMMEGQLGRLSEIIRGKEQELAELRAAVTAGFEERRELSAQVQALQDRLSGASSPGGASSQGGQAPPLLQSPSKPVSTSKPGLPYRTGLTSKPKFK